MVVVNSFTSSYINSLLLFHLIARWGDGVVPKVASSSLAPRA
jgi:hypothetical protein